MPDPCHVMPSLNPVSRIRMVSCVVLMLVRGPSPERAHAPVSPPPHNTATTRTRRLPIAKMSHLYENDMNNEMDPGGYDFSDFPDGIRAKTNETSGEISMSVDETNR